MYVDREKALHCAAFVLVIKTPERGMALKRLVWILLVLSSALSLVSAYHRIAAHVVARPMTTVMQVGRPFWIPFAPAVVNPRNTTTVGQLVMTAAHEADINMVRPSLGYTPSGTPSIMEFLYLTHHTRFFHGFSLRSGHFLTPGATQDGAALVSSVATGTPQQVGVLRVNRSVYMALQPLSRLPHFDVPWVGEYWVEASPQAYQLFVRDVVTAMNAKFSGGFVASDFTQGQSFDLASHASLGFAVWGSNFLQYALLFWGILVGITVVSLLYYGFSVAKRIGIYRLNGWSPGAIWYALVGRTVVLWILASAGIALLAGIVHYGLDEAWIGPLGGTMGVTDGLMLAASAVIWVYIHRVRIHDAVKQHRRTGAVLMMNVTVKAAAVVVLLVVGTAVWHEYQQLHTEKAVLAQWHHTQAMASFGVAYPVKVGYDRINDTEGGQSKSYVEARWLYPALARAGAIYLDARDYDEGALALPESRGFVRTVTVNPNYLAHYPIQTVHHQAVRVSETTRRWIVLVPEQYRPDRTKILKFVTEGRQSALEEEMSVLHTPAPPGLAHQKIQLIWIANGQPLFSWNPSVFPGQRNRIVSPIIQVQTLGNSLPEDWMNAITGGVASPLKIPLVHHSPAETIARWRPLLTRLHLADYLRTIMPVTQAVSHKIMILDRAIRWYVVLGTALFVMAVILMMQNTRVIFIHYQKRFLVRRLFGWGRLASYREGWAIIGASWVGQALAAVAVVGVKALAVAVPIGLAEIIIWAWTIRSVEQHQLAQRLKEGG